MKTYIICAKLRHAKKIYRDIEISEDDTLYDLASAILDSFNFDMDHLFGFGNKPSYYDSDIQYDLKTGDDFEIFLFGEGGGDVKKTKIWDIEFFREPKDKMSFLFDFGDDWEFEIELREFEKGVWNKKYPMVLKVNGESPSQYRDWGEE